MAKEVFRNLGQWFVEIVKVLFGFGGNLASILLGLVESIHEVAVISTAGLHVEDESLEDLGVVDTHIVVEELVDDVIEARAHA